MPIKNCYLQILAEHIKSYIEGDKHYNKQCREK